VFIQKVIYDLVHKIRKMRMDLLQKFLQDYWTTIFVLFVCLVWFCCQRPLQQETKKEHHEAVADCCVWLQSYTTSRWTRLATVLHNKQMDSQPQSQKT